MYIDRRTQAHSIVSITPDCVCVCVCEYCDVVARDSADCDRDPDSLTMGIT